MLGPAKFQLSGIAEDFMHSALLTSFNAPVKILESPAQALTQSPTHSALARTHEADQDHSSDLGLATA